MSSATATEKEVLDSQIRTVQTTREYMSDRMALAKANLDGAEKALQRAQASYQTYVKELSAIDALLNRLNMEREEMGG